MVNDPIIVAEMTINHLGMVKILKQMMKSAKEAGANYIKLKLKNVDKYYNDDNKTWRNLNFKDYRRSLELSKEDFAEVEAFCKEIGIKWFCTVHDKEGLDFLKQYDLPFFKVASMDSDKAELIDEVFSLCKDRNKPMIVSLGGKNQQFAERIISKITGQGVSLFILHTVSLYPTPPGKSNVSYLVDLQEKFAENKLVKFGYSGHEEGYGATLMAALYGAEMIERHFTLSLDYKIHHLKTALTPADFKRMTSLIKNLKKESGQESVEFFADEHQFLKNMDYNDYTG